MKITTPSRLHMTLIDLNAEIGRLDGGIGLALESPGIVLGAREADGLKVTGPLAERARDAAERVSAALGIEGGAELEIEQAYTPHIGLGSGTQVALAAGAALCRLYGRDVRPRELAKIVGRGGTSGIGTAAFESGGFILDGGHSSKEKPDFLPSSASKAPPAPVLARHDFPDWKIVLVVPKAKRKVHGGEEVSIFQTRCPIYIAEVRKLSHLILMKALPAVVEEDIVAFGEAVNEIQEIGFKGTEVNLQSREVKEILKTCQDHSHGAGLSSFGPAVYAIVEDEEELKGALEKFKLEELIITRANNTGARFEG